MEKFTKLTGVAAPLPLINVDTDMIIPKQFLKTIQRSGLGTLTENQKVSFEIQQGQNGKSSAVNLKAV